MIKIANKDSEFFTASADLIFTDPPFDMSASKLIQILRNYQADHLVLITTMAQLKGVFQSMDWDFAFDFVIDAVVPKQSKSIHQPNYTHQTGVYMKKPGVKSVFNRKKRQRSDAFDNKGYWPTVVRAPRNRMSDHGMAKNVEAITDILGSFEIQSVVDPFAGSGSVGLAAFDLGLDCILIEKSPVFFEQIRKTLGFIGASLEVV